MQVGDYNPLGGHALRLVMYYMDAIHIPTAPGPWAPQALLIVQIPNAQEIIIVLQENYPTQRVKVCSSVRTSTMLLLQTQMQMQAQTQTHMSKIESKMSVRVSFSNSCIRFFQRSAMRS
jgi:hypothetical protein